MNTNTYPSAPMQDGFAKPAYPAPQMMNAPPPAPVSQGGVLPPQMSGTFQGEAAYPQLQQQQQPMMGGYQQDRLPQMMPPSGSGYQLPQAPPPQARPPGPAFTGAGNAAYSSSTPAPQPQLQSAYPGNVAAMRPPNASMPMSAPMMQPQMAMGGMGGMSEANAIYEIQLRGDRLARKDILSKSDPYVMLISANGECVYKSETIVNEQSPHWKPFRVPLGRLAAGSRDQPFTIEVWDYDSTSKDDLIGRTRCCLRDLQPGVQLQLKNTGFHIQNPGKLVVEKSIRIQ